MWGWPTRPPNTQAPNDPSDVETLLVQRSEANSRFLTDCYLFPAALLSVRCPKIGQLARLAGRSITNRPAVGTARRFAEATHETLFKSVSWASTPILAVVGRLGGRRLSPAPGNSLSSPAGAGTPECRADPPRSGYAQGPAGRAGRAPAAPGAWRIRRPDPGVARLGAAWAVP